MSGKVVPFLFCRRCGKRGWEREQDAAKALGKAQTKRNRKAAACGTLRGVYRESRYYVCEEGMHHLTSQSRSTFNSYAEPSPYTSMAWGEFLEREAAPRRHLEVVRA